MKVIFERDSVCAGDDASAPNPAEFSFERPPLLSELLGQGVVETYLPNVSGARTFWSVICGGETAAWIEHNGSRNLPASIMLLRPDEVVFAEAVFFRYDNQGAFSD